MALKGIEVIGETLILYGIENRKLDKIHESGGRKLRMGCSWPRGGVWKLRNFLDINSVANDLSDLISCQSKMIFTAGIETYREEWHKTGSDVSRYDILKVSGLLCCLNAEEKKMYEVWWAGKGKSRKKQWRWSYFKLGCDSSGNCNGSYVHPVLEVFFGIRSSGTW